METDEIAMNALRQKTKTVQGLTDVTLRYPNAPARLRLHRRCFNANINHWLRSQSLIRAQSFVAELQSLQARLVASYHAVYDESDFMYCRF